MVYVVSGATGEYSDFCCWEVCAFMKKEDAEAMCARLNAWCKERGLDKEQPDDETECEREKMKPPDDPNFELAYTGTTYEILEIPIKE